MDRYFIEFILGIVILLFTGVGTLVILYWKFQNKRTDELILWLKSLDTKHSDSKETLVRIETRLEHYDELKEKQKHDHRAIRDLDKEVAKLKGALDALRLRFEGVINFCHQEHGVRIPD